MGQVVLHRSQRVVDDRTVTRPDDPDLLGRGEFVQPVQRGQVGPELAPGMRDHGRPTAKDGVAGQHGALGGDDERQGVGRVPRSAHHPDLEIVDAHHVAIGKSFRP
jgi:hypothetical protein